VLIFPQENHFPDATKKACDEADAILKGPIGLSHEESEKIPVEERPERGALLPMRRRLNTYANFRPISLPKGMAHFSPLKAEVVGEGIDILLVRELVGGLYFWRQRSAARQLKACVMLKRLLSTTSSRFVK
jgi:3-isopropylmalate dehydrogenase